MTCRYLIVDDVLTPLAIVWADRESEAIAKVADHWEVGGHDLEDEGYTVIDITDLDEVK